jgi:tetratricopeptide (TPR) repeat protein
MWTWLSESVWFVAGFLGLGALLGGYFRSWLEGYLPAYARVARFIRYHWTRNSSHFPPQVKDDHFLIILCCLENDDVKETAQRAVARALDKIHGIGVIRDHRMLQFNGTNRADAQSKNLRRADDILTEYKNPMAAIIWGEVVKRDESIRLHFRGVNSQELRDLTFEKGFVSSDVDDALGTVVAAVSIANIDPIASDRGSFVANRLDPLVLRLRDIAKQHQASFSNRTRWTILNALARALSVVGDQGGDNQSLKEACATFRASLDLSAREEAPLDWAMTQNNLGNALWALGEREAGTARLEEAVTAYREALKERTRERVPLDWAATQNTLGNALATLGQREAGTARLEEAVTAFREALKERTRDRVPLAWAVTQNNLGNAQRLLGERQAGTARLEEAVTTFREALKEYTRDRVPLYWAMTQNNLGAALQTLGAREEGTARPEEAVTAYREALKEYTRDRVPLDWAMTQNNLGNALSDLGEREVGTAQLEEAVTAFREALTEYTRDRVPLDWAGAQNNLGNALSALGRQEAGTARLEGAVAAYCEALKERTRDRVPLDWAMTQNNLGNCLAALAERSPTPGPILADAITHMQNAVDGFRQVGDEYRGPIAEKRLAVLKAKRQ